MNRRGSLTILAVLGAAVGACAGPDDATRLSTPTLTVAMTATAPAPQTAIEADETPPVDGGSEGPAEPCAPDMALVHGRYCTEVVEKCARWVEPPGFGGDGRCEVFAPTACVGARMAMRFCIDRDEYTPAGEVLPAAHASWMHANDVCKAAGRRLCLESEWNFACEGERMLPYPTGYTRDALACNFDRTNLLDGRGNPRDLRLPSASLVRCKSPFGVRNMVGNVDEWVMRDVTWGAWRSALKGGWWMAARNRCRPATTAHDEHYSDFQTGFRCCTEAAPPGTSAARDVLTKEVGTERRER